MLFNHLFSNFIKVDNYTLKENRKTEKQTGENLNEIGHTIRKLWIIESCNNSTTFMNQSRYNNE